MEDMTSRAIEVAGGPAAASRACGVTRQAVSQWKVVPPEHVIALSSAGGYQVTPHRLRPDIYPNPTDGLPPDVVGGFETVLGELVQDAG